MPKLPPLFATSLIMLTFVLTMVIALWRGWIPGADIYLETQLDKPYPQGNHLILPVRLSLYNPSGQIQSLPIQDVCKIFRWLILDQTSAFVQAKPSDPACVSTSIQRGLKPWEEIEEIILIKLDAKRFENNQPYFIIMRFWGMQSQQSFTLSQENSF